MNHSAARVALPCSLPYVASLLALPIPLLSGCSGAPAVLVRQGADGGVETSSPLMPIGADASGPGTPSRPDAAAPNDEASADAALSTRDASDAASGGDSAQCVSGQKSCAGQTPETCVNGAWTFASAPCSGASSICLNGVCGACSPMQTSCGQNADAGATEIQVCDGQGQWENSGTSCAYGCNGNQCGPLELAGMQMPFGAGLVSTGSQAYWFDGFESASIETCPVGGCAAAPTTIATAVSPSAFSGNLLALSAQFLFWPDGQTIGVAPLSPPSTPPTPGVFWTGSASSAPYQVVVAGSIVYWTDAGTGGIYQCAAGATCATPVTFLAPAPVPDGGTAVLPQLLAVDASNLYWSDTAGNVNSMALSGGSPVVLAAAAFPTSLVAFDGRAYWQTPSAVYSCLSGTPCSSLYSADPGGSFSGMATDGADLYWADAAGAVMKCALGPACAQPSVIASGQDTPSIVTVDAESVFWLAGSVTGGVYEYGK